jgi:general secretion pathway protein F
MLFGGVALPTALHHSGQAFKNSWLRVLAEQVNGLVKEGAPFGRSLGSTGEFPSLLVQLAITGERSGELPQMLAIAAKEFEGALSYRTTLLTAVLEPLLILLMGGIVLIIVLAVMMPLIEMNLML